MSDSREHIFYNTQELEVLKCFMSGKTYMAKTLLKVGAFWDSLSQCKAWSM